MLKMLAGLTMLVLVPVVTAVPASAAADEPSRLTADAYWNLEEQNTELSLLAVMDADGTGSLTLFSTRVFCDTATDELVLRRYFAQVPLTGRDFKMQPNLRHARLAMTAAVDTSDSRQPNCANPGRHSFTRLDPTTVTIKVTWKGDGAAYEVQPGSTARAATARGTVAGDVLPGTLDPSDRGELRAAS